MTFPLLRLGERYCLVEELCPSTLGPAAMVDVVKCGHYLHIIRGQKGSESTDKWAIEKLEKMNLILLQRTLKHKYVDRLNLLPLFPNRMSLP